MSLSAIEVVEQLRKALKNNLNDEEFTQAINSAISTHPDALLRRINMQPLYALILIQAISQNQIKSVKTVVTSVFETQSLKTQFQPLKTLVLSRLVNEASICAAFNLALSDSEVHLVLQKMDKLSLILDEWCLDGLKYPQFVIYCSNLPPTKSANFNNKLAAILSGTINVPASLTPQKSQIISYDHLVDSEVLKIRSLLNTQPYPPLNPEEWQQLLAHQDVRIRSAAAFAIGHYVANGHSQESAMRSLITLKQKIPKDTWLKALGYTYVFVSKVMLEPPARFPGDLSSDISNLVLPLTQKAEKTVMSQRTFNPEQVEKDGCWSYMDCFQVLGVLSLNLVDCLRERSAVAQLTVHQIRYICKELKKPAWQLFQPFWPYLAPKIVKNYDSNFVEWFATAVLESQKQTFFDGTLAVIVPHLCLIGGQQLRGCEEICAVKMIDDYKLYTEFAPGIIALLLMSGYKDVEQAWELAEEQWQSLSRKFRTVTFDYALENRREVVIYEILMLTNDLNADFAVKMIQKVQNLVPQKNATFEELEKIQQAVFKLIFRFSETMRNITGRQALAAKISALNGLRILISQLLTPNLVASVLRQLTAFLQASLEVNLLAHLSLKTWLAVINKLTDTKLESIIDLTYSIINDMIELWDRETVNCAKEIVREIKLRISLNPQFFSKSHAPSAFDEDCDVIASANSSADSNAVSCYDLLLGLVNRDVENLYIAKQTARDLCYFCLHFQPEIIAWTQGQGMEYSLLGKTVSKLLNLCSRGDSEIKAMSVRALGLLGALDSKKTVIKDHQPQFLMTSNFSDPQEVLEFYKILVRDKFLPVFEAAVNPSVQRYFAYGIQEVLKLMNAKTEKQLSKYFVDDGLVSTLSPLIKTRYSIKIEHYSHPTYPIYRKGQQYLTWLTLFCSDMMSRVSTPENAHQLFNWCKKILDGSKHGPDMWEFLFPYVCLAAILDPQRGTENAKVFVQEVNLLLELQGVALQQFHELIFAVLDYFHRWVNVTAKKPPARIPPSLDLVEQILASISADTLAHRAMDSGAFSRAILYFEEHIRDQPSDELEAIQCLRHMYAVIQDSDSLEGISAKISTLSVEQQVQEYTATSQWDAALACYSALPTSDENITAMLECLHRSGRDREVLAEIPPQSPVLAPLGAECAWSVRDWAKLSHWCRLIDPQITNSFRQVPPGAIQGLGQSLLALKFKDSDMFIGSLEICRQAIAKTLGKVISTHPVTSLRQIRELTVYLHGLSDLESLGLLVFPEDGSSPDLDESISIEIQEKLDRRLVVLSPSEGPEFEAKRFLLSLRGAALSCIQDILPNAGSLVAATHVAISAEARKHKQKTIALTEVATAKQLNHKDADSEHAKLLWSLGDHRGAIKMMQSQIPQQFFECPRKFSEYYELALEYTSWREHNSQADSSVLISQYEAVIAAAPEWSLAQYKLGKYYVKLNDSAKPEVRDLGNLAKNVVHHFSKCLILANTHASEALPKMLTTWLDLGIQNVNNPSAKPVRLENLRAANEDIGQWGRIIDKRHIYTAIPQLLSRYNHPDKSVKRLIEQLVVLVIQKYPYHALWPVLEKGESGNSIINTAAKSSKQSTLNLAQIISRATEFTHTFLTLCMAKADPKQTRISDLRIDFRTCLDLPQLAVPVQRIMDTLEPVRVWDIKNELQVLSSLQKPKKITVCGTDGETYTLLLKGNDDVRKDARLIEFTSAMNELLKTNAPSTSRNLSILTYRVTPLSQAAGIIEWVDGATPARYLTVQRTPNLEEGAIIKKVINPNLDIKTRSNAYQDLVKLIKPQLYKWFLITFADPEQWLQARTVYARSLAVMSMVGYILGLGDRHLENILLIGKSGSVLHVDFDCIFDKGKTLHVPERVPFRLTNNFLDALGVVNGYDGVFRKVCELTLEVIQTNEDLLMVILESFVHDPVVRDRQSSNPLKTMDNARSRIRGVWKPNTSPLGISGLVDELIKEATSPVNLCQMFRGWMPWV